MKNVCEISICINALSYMHTHTHTESRRNSLIESITHFFRRCINGRFIPTVGRAVQTKYDLLSFEGYLRWRICYEVLSYTQQEGYI